MCARPECLTSSLHPLRQLREPSCLMACRTASTASDLLSCEFRRLHSDTAPSCGGLNTSGYRVNRGATWVGIQPTCAWSISNLKQLARQEPVETSRSGYLKKKQHFLKSTMLYVNTLSVAHLVDKSYSFGAGVLVFFLTKLSLPF